MSRRTDRNDRILGRPPHFRRMIVCSSAARDDPRTRRHPSYRGASLNLAWVLVARLPVMLMQIEFAMGREGFTRAKNAVQHHGDESDNLSIGIIGFWLDRLRFMMGGWAIGLRRQRRK